MNSRPVFDYEAMYKMAESNRLEYQGAFPFPHAVIDHFTDDVLLTYALQQFPSPKDMQWWTYNNPLEKKLAQDRIELLPYVFQHILMEMNSGRFVKFLESLTGIEGLIPDPHFRGGGLHQIERGGKLDIHADYNFHPTLKLDRRLNVILYMNKDWKEEYGGHLELWNEDMKDFKKVLPKFNRMVCFNVTDKSFHGHPDPLNCPEDETRKSIAMYYYTCGRPEGERSEPHSTIYKARPQDDPNLEELRARRAKGRI